MDCSKRKNQNHLDVEHQAKDDFECQRCPCDRPLDSEILPSRNPSATPASRGTKLQPLQVSTVYIISFFEYPGFGGNNKNKKGIKCCVKRQSEFDETFYWFCFRDTKWVKADLRQQERTPNTTPNHQRQQERKPKGNVFKTLPGLCKPSCHCCWVRRHFVVCRTASMARWLSDGSRGGEEFWGYHVVLKKPNAIVLFHFCLFWLDFVVVFLVLDFVLLWLCFGASLPVSFFFAGWLGRFTGFQKHTLDEVLFDDLDVWWVSHWTAGRIE